MKVIKRKAPIDIEHSIQFTEKEWQIMKQCGESNGKMLLFLETPKHTTRCIELSFYSWSFEE